MKTRVLRIIGRRPTICSLQHLTPLGVSLRHGMGGGVWVHRVVKLQPRLFLSEERGGRRVFSFASERLLAFFWNHKKEALCLLTVEDLLVFPWAYVLLMRALYPPSV